MLANAYAQYKNNAVETATPEELTLMLYNGALRFCNQAIEAIDNKDMTKANEFIIKAQNIIQEFRITLDRQYEIALQLDRLYEYLHHRLITANIKKDKEILTEVREHIRSMRDNWKEAMKIARQQKATGIPSGLGKVEA